jgi:hypothetical protein
VAEALLVVPAKWPTSRWGGVVRLAAACGWDRGSTRRGGARCRLGVKAAPVSPSFPAEFSGR